MFILNTFLLVLQWILTTILWLLFWIPTYLTGFLVTWIGLLFCNKNSEHMPRLWWLWDNSHGINGTLNNNNLNWVVICNPEIYDLPFDERLKQIQLLVENKTGKERTFKNRWIWITWRNPVSNLSLYPMGINIKKSVFRKEFKFKRFVFEKVSCGLFWFYSATFKYNADRGFYYSFGWKFLDPADDRARFIYRISPFKKLK